MLQSVSILDWTLTKLVSLEKTGVRLRTIQDLGGWSSMAALQRYLEVSEEEKVSAIGRL